MKPGWKSAGVPDTQPQRCADKVPCRAEDKENFPR